MRPWWTARRATVGAVALSVLLSCASLEGLTGNAGDAGSPGDGSVADAPATDGGRDTASDVSTGGDSNSGDDGSYFCEQKGDAHTFCFDFDQYPLTHDWAYD